MQKDAVRPFCNSRLSGNDWSARKITRLPLIFAKEQIVVFIREGNYFRRKKIYQRRQHQERSNRIFPLPVSASISNSLLTTFGEDGDLPDQTGRTMGGRHDPLLKMFFLKDDGTIHEFSAEVSKRWTAAQEWLHSGVIQEWSSRRLRVLEVYLAGEMVPIFVLGVAICAMLGMSLGALAQLMREVAVAGLPLRVAFGAAILQVPRFAALAAPMACLGAVLLVFSRLRSDAELVALAAAGVSSWRLLVAPVGLAVVAALLTLACNDIVVPKATARARRMVETAVTAELCSLRPQDNMLYKEYSTGGEVFGELLSGETFDRTASTRAPSRIRKTLRRVWYADRMEGGIMYGLTMLEVAPSGDLRTVVTADSCNWNWPDRVWELSSCIALQLATDISPCRVLEAKKLELPMPDQPLAANWAAFDVHFPARHEVWARINELEQELISSVRQADAASEDLKENKPEIWVTPSGKLQWRGKKKRGGVLGGFLGSGKVTGKEAEILEAECNLRQRDAAAFSCLIYALIGAAATVAFSRQEGKDFRGGRSGPFITALGFVVLYNILSALSATAGIQGILSPTASAWLPSVAGLSIGPALILATSPKKKD